MQRLVCHVLWLTAAATAGHAAGPLDPFLMQPEREVALARSAAPPELATRAGVLVLAASGYREVEPSLNGFNCLVLRSFTQPTSDPASFIDPRILGPICYNPEASRSVMPRELRIASSVAGGAGFEAVAGDLAAANAAGELPTPRGLALAYMLSAAQWLGERVEHWHPHVMLFAPHLSNPEAGGFGVDSGWPVVDPRPGAHAFVAIPVARSIDPEPPKGGAAGSAQPAAR